MINKIALFKPIQNFIKKTKSPEFYKRLNNTLPLIESSFATICYSGAIWQNKTIEEDRKMPLQWQNLICGSTGILASKKINDIITIHQEKLIKELNNYNIPKINNIIKGIKILLPLVITSFMLRFLIPIISTPISTFIELKRNKGKNNANR